MFGPIVQNGRYPCMDASLIIAAAKRRLLVLAENPPYAYRDAPQHLIEQHQERQKTFGGFSETDVAAAEQRLGLRLPTVFRAYLLELGKFRGELFRGSDVAGIDDFDQFRADALALMAETDSSLNLPADAIVFQFHQGYTFLFLHANGAFDGPVLQYIENEPAPAQAYDAFAEMLDSELSLAEKNHASFHARGGYYKTLHPGGTATDSFPALNSGDRPLDRVSKIAKRWWQIWR